MLESAQIPRHRSLSSRNPAGRLDRVPTLTLFCGLPGAGKTTLAKQLERDGCGVRICTDDWQADLGVAHAEETFHDRLQQLLFRLAVELLLRGVDVILEDGLWTLPERTEKLAAARELNARVELHFFDLSLEDLWTRVRHRNATAHAAAVPITRESLESYWRVFQPPDQAELATFDHVFMYR